MKVAAIQMVSSVDVAANLDTARQLLAQAASQGAELAVLPEHFYLLGFKDTDKLQIAEQPGHGQLQDFLRQCAREFKLWLVGGTLPLATGQAADDSARVYNSTLVYDPAGQNVADRKSVV